METKDRKNKSRGVGSETRTSGIKDTMNRWIAKSPKLEKFVEETGYYIKNPDKFTERVNELYNTATNEHGEKSIGEFAGKAKSLYRMIKMSMSGEYQGIPKAHVYIGIAALAYLLSPVDILPDSLGFFGFADDAALMIWLIKYAAEEVSKFEQWEQGQGAASVSY